MGASVQSVNDRIDDARCAIDDVERGVEPLFHDLGFGDGNRVLVANPAGIDAVHVDTRVVIVGR